MNQKQKEIYQSSLCPFPPFFYLFNLSVSFFCPQLDACNLTKVVAEAAVISRQSQSFIVNRHRLLLAVLRS